MNESATREILWNVGTLPNVIAMYLLFALSLLIGLSGIFRHAELWLSGKPTKSENTPLLRRLWHLFAWGLLQRGVIRETFPAIAHSLIYLGFLVLLFTTTMVFLDHDLGFEIYRGNFYLAITLLSDLLGLGLLVGCALAAHRRYIQKADLVHNRLADAIVLILLALLVIQGFILEGLRIHVTGDKWAIYSPVGLLVARLFWPLSPTSAATLHYLTWWFHTLTVFAAVAIIPYTKFFHVLASAANLFFFRSDHKQGVIESPGDIEAVLEAGEEFSLGLGDIRDYSWKHLLDLDACTSCGRCQDACPAYLSGKPLSPKWLILDTRNHALALHADEKLGASLLPAPLKELDRRLTRNFFLESSGLRPRSDGSAGYAGDGQFRANNSEVQSSVRFIGRSAEDKISGDVMNPDVFWACTTCLACVEACPVGINHVDQIIGNRRHMVLMEGKLPAEPQSTLRALENRGNPFGDPNDREKWHAGLDVRVLQPGDSVDYLYWVGCVSAYDPRKQKIARALATVLKRSGISFATLGKRERCTGDPARRLGEENLFQSLCKTNLETIRGVRFKTLVTGCPHCFNIFKNEYPQFGTIGGNPESEPEILHHSQLLERLIRERRVEFQQKEGEAITFHDPCYLGRYNSEYDAPRASLNAAGHSISEMQRSRNKGMCCGAGGGHFWMDMKIGQRVNSIRVDQAAETGAKKICTACPFCMQMLEDGIKSTNREKEMEVQDLAEILADQLPPE